jgi:hypothetical protein
VTAQTIVNNALTLIEAISPTEGPTTTESADGLAALIALLASWSADELLVYATRTAAVALTNGTVSYAIPGARPVKILSADCTVAASGMNFPLEVLGPDAWARVNGKTSSSVYTQAVYCDYAYPTPALLVAPKPTGGATVDLFCMVDLATVAALTDTFDLPEGYTKAIEFNLAVDLAPQFGRSVSAELAMNATTTKEQMRRLMASNRAGHSELGLPDPPPAAPQQPR